MHAAAIPDEAALYEIVVRVADALRAQRLMLATAESCTGGWIAKAITDLPGSSEWFVGGIVAYSNALKHALLGVSADTLATHGAVSRECALQMVAGVVARTDADLAIAVTGIAGPGGGSADKPVGTVWIAWWPRGEPVVVEMFRFDGDRDAVRRRTVAAALEGLLALIG